MPQAVILIATEISALAANAAIAAGASFGTVNAISAIAYSASEIAITTGLVAGVALALAPRVPNAVATQTPLKQPVPDRLSGWGRARIGGKYALYTARKGVSYNVTANHDGLIDGWERFWLNDDEVFLNADQGVIAKHGTRYGMIDGVIPRVYMYHTLGAVPSPGFPAIASALGDIWTSDHRGDYVAAIGMTAKQGKLNDQAGVFPNGDPVPSASGRLARIYDPRLNGIGSMGDPANWSWSANPILMILDYLATSDRGGMGLSFEKRIKPSIDKWIHAADVCDEAVAVGTAESSLTANSALGTHALSLFGVQGLGVGSTVLLNKNTATQETLTVTAIDGATIDVSPNLEFAHVPGEPIEWTRTVSGTEARYAAGGIYDWANAPKDVLAAPIAACDGWLGQAADGSLVVYAGEYYEPSVILTDDHILGYSVSGRPQDEEAVNQFLITFTDPNTAFNQADGGQWDDTADQARRGKTRSQKFDLPYVQSIGQAGRLAQRAMTRATAPLRGTIKTNLYGMNALGERYIRVKSATEFLLRDLVIEITGAPKIDLKTLTLTFPWTAADVEIDNGWTTSHETAQTPVTAPIVAAPSAPTIVSITPQYDQTSSSDTGARLQIVAETPTGAPDAIWLMQWRVTGTTVWTQSPVVGDGASPATLLSDFVAAASGTELDVEVAYQTAGALSPWSATSTVTLATPSTAFDTAVNALIDTALSEAVGLGFEVEGLLANNELLARSSWPVDVTFTNGEPLSYLQASPGFAATADAVFRLLDEALVEVGTITVPAGTRQGTVAWTTSPYVHPARTTLLCYAPSPADATLGNLNCLIRGKGA